MSLREQILSELKEQDGIAQAQINKLKDEISGEAFAMSAISGGALSGAARSACQSRMDAALTKQNRVKQENVWVSEMLSKYY